MSHYESFEKDAKGRPLDIVVDWVGLPRDLVLTRKARAILITLAANSAVDRFYEIRSFENDGFSQDRLPRLDGQGRHLRMGFLLGNDDIACFEIKNPLTGLESDVWLFLVIWFGYKIIRPGFHAGDQVVGTSLGFDHNDVYIPASQCVFGD